MPSGRDKMFLLYDQPQLSLAPILSYMSGDNAMRFVMSQSQVTDVQGQAGDVHECGGQVRKQQRHGDCAEPFEREQPSLGVLTPFLKGVGNLIEMLTATV